MSKLIIVCGLGGSGKTTTAKALSKKLNIVCLHKDKIKAVVHDVLELQTPKALSLLLKLTEEQIANEVDLIIEGPFNFKEDALIFERWKEKYKLDLSFIICSTDVQTRINRIESRERHACHADADVKLLNQIKTEVFDYSIMPGRQIKIVTNQATEKLIEDIVQKLQ